MEGGGVRGAMLAHGLILMRKYYAIFGRVSGNILPLEALYRVCTGVMLAHGLHVQSQDIKVSCVFV